MTKFIVGSHYATRSICDHDCIFAFEILARTEKTITTKVHGKIVRRGLRVANGVECFAPFGQYSMSPTIDATKLAGEV